MTARLSCVSLGARDVGRAAALWVDLLGGQVLDGSAHHLEVALPHGVRLAIHHTDDEPGVTGAELAVADPEAVAGALRDDLGLSTRAVGDTLAVDAGDLLGGVLALAAGEARTVPEVPGGGAAGVRTFDHLCFGVRDLAGAAAALRATGGWITFGGDSPHGIRSLHLRYDVGKLELLSPLRDDSEVGRHLARRGGPAPHHVTLLVEDVPAARAAAHDLGFETTWTDLEHETWRDTYLRPATTEGVVVQLAVTTRSYDAPLSARDVERVFEGYWWVAHHEMRPIEEVAP